MSSDDSRPVIVILMGSPADRDHAAKIADTAAALGVDVETRIGSAHKTPQHVLDIVEQYEADPRPKVWVTIAGRSNALSAFVDAAVSAPVIACPPLSMPEDVWSSLRMPTDVSPMVVLDPANAAQAAAKILGLTDANIAARVRAARVERAARVIDADQALGGD